MKRLFFTLLLAASFSTAWAQVCTPDTSIKQPGLYPRQLPNATVGTNYSEVVQFKFPSDTSYSGFPIKIDSVRIDSVSGMPSGFSYTCSSSGCLYKGGGNGCVIFAGAPASSQQGHYTLNVHALAKVESNLIDTPFWVPYNDTLSFNVVHNTGIFQPAGYQVPLSFSINGNYPNPFDYVTNIVYTSPSAGQVVFKVYDILGNVIYKQNYSAESGENTLTYDRTGVRSGLYLYSLQFGDRVITRRMMIED
jgi:hypothetical protein